MAGPKRKVAQRPKVSPISYQNESTGFLVSPIVDDADFREAITEPSVVTAEYRPDLTRAQAYNYLQGQKAPGGAEYVSSEMNRIGSDYVAPAFAATMAAPFVIGEAGAAVANPVETGKALVEGLKYLQPSKYLDPIAKGLGASSPYGFYSGATTMAGGVADALMDSYFAVEGAKNAGKTGSVPGEILNAMNFLPLAAPLSVGAGKIYGAVRGARAAKQARTAADLEAIKNGLARMTHNATGEVVYVDPTTKDVFQYINGEMRPFELKDYTGWVPDSMQEEIKAIVQSNMNDKSSFDWDKFEELAISPESISAPDLAIEDILAKAKNISGGEDTYSFISNLDDNSNYFGLFDGYSERQLEDMIDALNMNNDSTSLMLAGQIEGYLKKQAQLPPPPAEVRIPGLSGPEPRVKAGASSASDMAGNAVSIMKSGMPKWEKAASYVNTNAGKDKINDLIAGLEDSEITDLVEALRSSGDDDAVVYANAIRRAIGEKVPVSELSNAEKSVYINRADGAIASIRRGYPDDWSIEKIIENSDRDALVSWFDDPFDDDYLGTVLAGLELRGDPDAKALLKAAEGYDAKAINEMRKQAKGKFSSTGMGGPSRNTPVWNKVHRIIYDAKKGNRPPLPTKAKDIFGEEFDLPDYMAAFMETEEFKEMYPDGVDFFWRGTGEDPNWHKAYTSYNSYFGGNRSMAGGYNAGGFSGGKPVKLSTTAKEGEVPNVMLMYVPKGQLYWAEPQSGAGWADMLHDASGELPRLADRGARLIEEIEKAEKKVDKLSKAYSSSMTKDARAEFDAAVKELDSLKDELNVNNKEFNNARRGHLLRIPKLGRGVFGSTDDIANALNPEIGFPSLEFPYSGVVIPDVHDGPRANEIIWNHLRGGYPKVVHPEMKMNGRLGDKTYLNHGGTLLRRFDNGGGVPVFSPLADFRSSHPMTLPKPALRVKKEGFQGFGGGEFGGAGASGYWDVSLDPLVASQYVRNTPIMGERSFSDAYAEARKAGLPDFMFNGQRYTTDYDPDAKLGKHKYEPTAVLNIREVLDENKKPIADSTRIEPWLGQIPGVHERRYDGGGDIEYDIEPAIVKPAPVRVNLYTDSITRETPITHSWMEAGPRDGNDLGFRVSKGSFDPTYNLLLANCSDATGEILEALSGQDFTSGITTPYGVRRKAREVFGSYPMYGETGDKTTVQSFYVPWYDYRKAKDVANSQQLETNLALAKKHGAGPEVLQQIRDTWAESHPVLPYTLDADGNVVSYKKGGGIHIDPSKKGTFRAQAAKMGMSVKQAAAHILAHKENYSPAMVKKANFARNFAGDGGLLERYGTDRIKEALEKIKRG